MPKGDRVVVLEDTDGDGRADKSTTFVQEPTLVAPLGIAVHRQQDHRLERAGSHRLHRRESRPEFRSGRRQARSAAHGFDGRNHDHALHSVTFGPDGRWYFSQGNAGAYFTDRGGKTFRVGSAYNPVPDGGAQPVFGFAPPSYAGAKSDDGHVYVGGFSARMQPDGTGVEILGFNFRNSYEQTVTSFGDIFHNDNDDPPACRTTYLMEYGNFGFFSRDGKRYWQADRRPGPVDSHRRMAPGRSGRDSLRRCLRRRRADRHRVQRRRRARQEMARPVAVGARPRATPSSAISRRRDGAGYQLERFDFLTSNKAQAFAGTDFKGGKVNAEIQTFFRPSDVAVGPDGAIYVADWFDPRVGGHDDKDDTTSGAIYRIAPKGFKPRVPAFDARDRSKARSRRCAVRRSMCARWVSRRSRRAAPAALPAVADSCSMTRIPTCARAPCGCSRGSGADGVGARRSDCSTARTPMTARHGVSRAAAGGPRAAHARAARARSFAGRAARSGAVTA